MDAPPIDLMLAIQRDTPPSTESIPKDFLQKEKFHKNYTNIFAAVLTQRSRTLDWLSCDGLLQRIAHAHLEQQMAKAVHVNRFRCEYFAVLHEKRSIKRRHAQHKVLNVQQPGNAIANYHISRLHMTEWHPFGVQETKRFQYLTPINGNVTLWQSGASVRIAVLDEKWIFRLWSAQQIFDWTFGGEAAYD